MLLLGRIILGFSGGSLTVIGCRFIYEFVPVKRQNECIAFFFVNVNFGSFIALCSSVVLPKDDDTEDQLSNKTWRLIFGFPLIMFSYILLCLTFLFRNDSPTYYLSKSQRKNALKAVHKMYKTGGAEYLAEQVLTEI